jgi:hypothetical protein
MALREVIKWQPVGDELILVAVQVEIGNQHARGLEETDLDPIHQWSEQTGCGKRTSFDAWKFQNESELAMFRLRWIHD